MQKIDAIHARIQTLLERGVAESDSAITTRHDSIHTLLTQQRRYIKKDEIWELYQANGGTELNAWTGDDMTAYIVTLPKNKLDLFYWIESDRMANPVLREFYSERDVVTEERRMRYDNRPQNNYFERLMGIFYVAHPYRIPTIGWMSDIRSYSREKLQKHVQQFYTPDNALIVLAGNVDTAQALGQIKRYFGTIPAAATQKPHVVTREPKPLGQTRFSVTEKAQPRLDILLHTPGFPNNDLYALDILEGVLNDRSGRLYKRLVLEEGLCTDAGAANAFRLHDGYFHIWASLKDDTDPKVVERIIQEEIQKLQTEQPRQQELDRVKNTIRMSFVSGLTSLEGISDKLAWFERLGGWNYLLTYPKTIAQIQPAHLPAIAKQYLDITRATIGTMTRSTEPQS
jgi:predicted Zn-dependent peptidase